MINCNVEALTPYVDPDRQGQTQEETAIAARLSITERCADCRRQKENLLKAIELLKDVPTEHRYEFSAQNPDDACLYVERVFWQRFVEDTGIKSAMSIKKREELDGQLYQKQHQWNQPAPLPPFDEEHVFAFFDQICGNMGAMIKDAIAEVFQWLRPSHGHYKTNDEFQIGKKVILTCMAEGNWSHSRMVNYHRRAHVDALGNVLSMLDGKGVRKHPDTLSNAMTKAWGESDTFEDAYLIAKSFANGNAHITFKRLDLIAQINQSADALWLRQQSEQKNRGFSH